MAGDFDGLSVRPPVVGRGPDLHATPSCTGTVARPWPAAPMGVLPPGACRSRDRHAAAAQALRAILLRSGGTAVACIGATSSCWSRTSPARSHRRRVAAILLRSGGTAVVCAATARAFHAVLLRGGGMTLTCGFGAGRGLGGARSCRWSAAHRLVQELRHGRGLLLRWLLRSTSRGWSRT